MEGCYIVKMNYGKYVCEKCGKQEFKIHADDYNAMEKENTTLKARVDRLRATLTDIVIDADDWRSSVTEGQARKALMDDTEAAGEGT